ncbi:initiator tRNA phosphoribosyl transferase [Martensiomyces pterosporus]|nr:initiator tRNA phosphoribosyl transferase [Martensiomyces pterosporus]
MDGLFTNEIHSVTEELRRDSKSLYNRLRSIDDDADFVRSVAGRLPGYPVVANERCGTWYVDPSIIHPLTVYFKSTDGHNGNWKFNLRRANTQLFDVLARHSGCLIVDSTRRGKSMPDSFAKTIPIWCAVWNMAIARVRKIKQDGEWDCRVHTPPSLVSPSENDQIEKLLPSFVDGLMASGIDVAGLTGGVERPLRPIWITRDHRMSIMPDFTDASFIPVICVSASNTTTQRVEATSSRPAYLYIQGSADDHELWAAGLMPRLFWKHKASLLSDKDGCESVAQGIVSSGSANDPTGGEAGELQSRFNYVKDTGVAVGDRISGQPPECWSLFDAIVNCGSPEYEKNKDEVLKSRYLFLDIPEGKRGQVELAKSIPKALEFVKPFVEQKKRVLIHCSQGMDRSVGIALAVLAQYFDANGKRAWQNVPLSATPMRQITKETIHSRLLWITTSRVKANPSRVTLKRVNRHFLDFF